MTEELVVASFNIHWGVGGWPEFRPFDVAAACASLGADVLVLQEVWHPDAATSQQQQIADATGMRVIVDQALARATIDGRPETVGRADSTEGTGSWGIALLSRFDVTSAQAHPLPDFPMDDVDRAMLRAELAIGDRRLTVCGTHFTHLKYGSPLHGPGLRRTLPPANEPALLLGDMNMWGFVLDAVKPKGWRRGLKGKTWPAHRPWHQIDHLLVTPEVEVLDAEVMPDLGSDHRAIRARVRIR